MNSLRFWGKKRPREQSEAKNRNVQQQKADEATGNISKNEVEKKALQAKTAVIELEEYQKLMNAQQIKIVGLEQNQQNLDKLVAEVSKKAAKFVECEKVEQMKLELKEETNRKLEEMANNSKDPIEKRMNKLKEELSAKMEQYQKELQQKMEQHQKELQQKMEQHQKDLQQKMEQHQKDLQQKMEQHQKDLQQKMEQHQKEEQQKVEHYQKEQQQNIDALTDAQKGNVEQFSLLREKIDELERKQKADQEEHRAKIDENKQQLNIEDLQKTVSEFNLTPQNRWDSAACHDKLTLIKPNQVIAQQTGGYSTNMLLSDSFCLRGTALSKEFFRLFLLRSENVWKRHFYIGLAPKQMPLDGWVGEYDGTYAYGSDGCFSGYAVNGCRKSFKGGAKSRFAGGAVVGCGVDLASRQIIYTKNGRRLDTAALFVVDSAADLFPCVTLYHPTAKIEANFGPEFKYKF